MIAAEIFIRGLLFAALAFALVAGVALILGWLARANGTIDRILDDVYDWDREGDFDGHHPEGKTWPESVVVRCTCGHYSHTEPIFTTESSAIASAMNEYHSTHMQEVAA